MNDREKESRSSTSGEVQRTREYVSCSCFSERDKERGREGVREEKEGRGGKKKKEANSSDTTVGQSLPTHSLFCHASRLGRYTRY